MLTPKPTQMFKALPTDVNFRVFSELNRLRSESPHGFNHPLSSWSLSDWMVAFFGEVGEAANVLKKLNRYRDGIPGNNESIEELREKFKKELADAFCYLDLLAQAGDVDLSQAVVDKFNEVNQRIEAF